MSDTQIAMAMAASLIFAGLVVTLGGPQVLGDDFKTPSEIDSCRQSQGFLHEWDNQFQWEQGDTTGMDVSQDGVLSAQGDGLWWDSQTLTYPEGTPVIIRWEDFTIPTGGSIDTVVYSGDQDPSNVIAIYTIDDTTSDPAKTASSFTMGSDETSIRLSFKFGGGTSPEISRVVYRAEQPGDEGGLTGFLSDLSSIPSGIISWFSCWGTVAGSLLTVVLSDTGFAVLGAILTLFAVGFIIIVAKIVRGN